MAGLWILVTFMEVILKLSIQKSRLHILQESSQRYTDSLAIICNKYGGFSHMGLWLCRLLNFRYGVLKTLMPNVLDNFSKVYIYKNFETSI